MHPETSASPTPTSQGLPSLIFSLGSLAAQHRRPPNGGGQQQAQRRRAQKKVVGGAAGNENIPTTGGDGGWRHTLPAKEGNALTPQVSPMASTSGDTRQHGNE